MVFRLNCQNVYSVDVIGGKIAKVRHFDTTKATQKWPLFAKAAVVTVRQCAVNNPCRALKTATYRPSYYLKMP